MFSLRFLSTFFLEKKPSQRSSWLISTLTLGSNEMLNSRKRQFILWAHQTTKRHLLWSFIFWQTHLWYNKSTAEHHTWVTYLPGMGLVLALHRFWGQEVRMAVGFTILIRGCIYLQYLYLYLYMCEYWNLYLYMFCNVLYLYWYLSVLCLCSVPIYLVIRISICLSYLILSYLVLSYLILSYLILSIQIPTALISIPKHPTKSQWR